MSGWNGGGHTSVIHDMKVPIKLNGKFYHTNVRLTMLYVTECQTIKNQHDNKLCVS